MKNRSSISVHVILPIVLFISDLVNSDDPRFVPKMSDLERRREREQLVLIDSHDISTDGRHQQEAKDIQAMLRLRGLAERLGQQIETTQTKIFQALGALDSGGHLLADQVRFVQIQTEDNTRGLVIWTSNGFYVSLKFVLLLHVMVLIILGLLCLPRSDHGQKTSAAVTMPQIQIISSRKIEV